MVDIEEVFNLWTLLENGYEFIAQIHLLENFIHDRDLSLIAGRLEEILEARAKDLENEAKILQFKLPSRPPKELKSSVRVEEVTDRFIYRRLYMDLRSDLFTVNRAVRTTTTNDGLRSMFTRFLRTELSHFDELIMYGKSKGWIPVPPTHKTSKQIQREQINVGEAYHLWDHLNLRYDQLQQTQFFAGFSHDEEFTVVLNLGTLTLKNQISTLENLMIQFEIPLPERPPVAMRSPIDPESLEDIYMFRTIFRGIQEAMDLHLRATVEATRNDDLRSTFREFLDAEISLFDRFLKYGKMKGWTHIPPPYIEPT